MIRVGVDTPAVVVAEGNGHITAKQLGILRAMRHAASVAPLGEPIVQADMKLRPFVKVFTNLEPGAVTILDDPTSWPAHVCPRSFIIPDEHTRQWLLALWAGETVNACRGWWPLPKVQGPVMFEHAANRAVLITCADRRNVN